MRNRPGSTSHRPRGSTPRPGSMWRSCRGGPAITPSEVLAAGKADVAVDWMPSALAARDKGAPIVNIAQIFQHSGLQLVCRRDSGIRRPADFKGKKIGVWFVGNDYPFLAWVAKLGFTTGGANPDLPV